jgi:hypothetical protein
MNPMQPNPPPPAYSLMNARFQTVSIWDLLLVTLATLSINLYNDIDCLATVKSAKYKYNNKYQVQVESANTKFVHKLGSHNSICNMIENILC